MKRRLLSLMLLAWPACRAEPVEIALPVVGGAQTLILAQSEEIQNPPTFDVRVIDLNAPVGAELLPGLAESGAEDPVRYTAVYHLASIDELRLIAGRNVRPGPDDPSVRFGALVDTATVYESRYTMDRLGDWTRVDEIEANLAGVTLPSQSSCVVLEALPNPVELPRHVGVGYVLDAGRGRLLVQTRAGGLFSEPVGLFLVERDRYDRPRIVRNFETSVGLAFRGGFTNRSDGSLWFVGPHLEVVRAGGVEPVGADEAELVDVTQVYVPASTSCDNTQPDPWICRPQCDVAPFESDRLPFFVDGNAGPDGRFEIFILSRSGAFEVFDGLGPPECLHTFATDGRQLGSVAWIESGRAAAVMQSEPDLLIYDHGTVRVEQPGEQAQLTTVRALTPFGLVAATAQGGLLFGDGEADYKAMPSGADVPIFDVGVMRNPTTLEDGVIFGGNLTNAGQAWPSRDAVGCPDDRLTRQHSRFVRPLGSDAFLFVGDRSSLGREDPILGTVIVPRYDP